ncbi:MAG: hypothetical protein AAF483_15705 [Planctomycetota bacterium]
MNKTIYNLALCGTMLVLASGCSTFQKDSSGKSDSWSITSLWKKEYQTPSSLAVIWSPDVLTVSGKAPTRGFGGRIFFYNEKSQAIPVEGDVVVHGFAGDPARTAADQADKTFAFTAEQLTQHFSPSQLGASYSIWVPWDAAGGYQDQVTLIPTFRTKEGGIVQGAPAKLMLPGKTRKLPADFTRNRKLPAQTVSYRASSSPTNLGVKIPEIGSKSDITTIDVSESATIAKQPSRRSFELGRGPEKLQPNSAADGAKGVSVGGVNAFHSAIPSLPQNLNGAAASGYVGTSSGHNPGLQLSLPAKSASESGSKTSFELQQGQPAKVNDSQMHRGFPSIENRTNAFDLRTELERLPKPRLHSLPPPKKDVFVRQQIPRVDMVRSASFTGSKNSTTVGK